MDRKAFLVVNPRSANGRTGRAWAPVEALLRERLGPLEIGLTERPLHAEELTRSALQRGFDLIVAVGGDGTVNEVVNGFFAAGEPVAPAAALSVLPSGTGRDLARGLGVAHANTEELIGRIASGALRQIDCGLATYSDAQGRVHSRRFLNEASFGFSAQTVAAVNRSSKALGGKVSFALGVFRCLAGLRNVPVTLRADGEQVFAGDAFLVAVANGRYFGGGMMIAPGAAIDDGLFDVVAVGAMRRFDVVKNLRLIYEGRHVGRRSVTSLRCQVLEAEASEPVLLEMDGEQPGQLSARFELQAGALSLLGL